MVFSDATQAGKSTHTIDVNPKESDLFSLNDEDILELAQYAVTIELHYGCPMDIEWGKNGLDGKIYILQARPETVKSQSKNAVEIFKLKESGKAIVAGRAVTQKIGVGPVRIVKDPSEMHAVQPGDVLVADMTDPNWEPVMKRASALVTNRGGRTCHAAIIARELGIPAIVGSVNATELLQDGDMVTVCCSEGETGLVFQGALEYEVNTEKETVTMTPNNGQSTVRPGQRIIVDLPFNSTVDLSTFTWFFKGQTTHLGAAVTGTEIVAAAGNLAIQFCGSRFFPSWYSGFFLSTFLHWL